MARASASTGINADDPTRPIRRLVSADDSVGDEALTRDDEPLDPVRLAC